MRIIQTVNDTIRLLFNPKTEVFRLSDFLLIRDLDENFLAQVVEVYDDKFDQEANVAKIKLVYRIVNGNEIAPFDNYTPSRECEVAKIKQSEIEKCINLKKKTITLGTNYFSKEKMDINTNFFENNCVIFADKFEQTNQIFENLAPRLTEIKPVLILDFSGNCRLDGISPYVAGANFKLPLSSDTIDYIQQKTLIRAKLETQVVLGDVFEEVKKFLEDTEDNYIPFQRFIKVVQAQCKQTPSVELLVLISWLKKYSRENIFAKNKREFEAFFKSLTKNKITILDLSNIKTEWQKEHLEYIINTIQNDVFVLIRLNDNNVNNDIINNIYLKKENISLIPSFAYGYKKAPYIMDFALNYILMPTLNPKRDFVHANFQVQSLNKDAYLIFGEDTKDFIFTLENEAPAKKKNKDDENKDKVFISLNLQLEDMTPLELRPNNFEIKQQEPRKKRLQEEIKLSDVLSVEKADNEIQQAKPEEKPTIPAIIPVFELPTEENKVMEFVEEEKEEQQENVENVENLENIEENKEQEIKEEIKEETEPASTEAVEIEEEVIEVENTENLLGEDELDFFEQGDVIDVEEEVIEESEEIKEEAEIEQKQEDLPKIKEETKEEETIEPKNELEAFAMTQEEDEEENIEEASEEVEEAEENIDDKVAEILTEETNNEPETEEKTEIEEAGDVVSNIIDEAVKEKEDEAQEDIEEKTEEEPKAQDLPETEEEQEDAQDVDDEDLGIAPKKAEEEAAIYDDEEDLGIAPDENEIKEVKEKTEEEIKAEEEAKENAEIDKQFDEIMNETAVSDKDTNSIQVNENVSIDIEKIKKDIDKKETKLPVFDEEDENQTQNTREFKEGDKVSHHKYGNGEVIKVIQYGERCLLQIDFPEIETKRLLDPKIAKLELIEE